MSDLLTAYETGLSLLPKRLGHSHPHYTEALTLQARLLENLARVRLYSDLEMARRAGDLAAQEAALGNLGRAYAAQGDFRQAVEWYERASTLARERGNRQAEAIYLQNLGLALLRLADAKPDQRQSHLSRAADSLRQAVELFDALNTPPLQRARVRYHLGRCYGQLGRWREAIALLEQARETFSRHKARPELAHTLPELGQLYHQRQDFESAYLYLKDALRLFRRMKDTDGIAVTQEALGNLALQTARPAEALASLQEARQHYATLKRSERIRAVDDLLRVARQAHQVWAGKGVAQGSARGAEYPGRRHRPVAAWTEAAGLSIDRALHLSLTGHFRTDVGSVQREHHVAPHEHR
ncbi:MAG TPA: tetratricopeptide repeat protein [Anaerolineae bacterium]|nr:tetratricopeptide repeat protein [Anaerolineae bacterium]